MLRKIVSLDTLRENRVPPGQHLLERWPVLHYGSVQAVNVSEWKFKVMGLVEKEKDLSFKEFTTLPQVEVYSDIHCVTRWSRLNNTWKGVSAKTIMDLASVLPKARYVMVHGAGGFSTNLGLEDFLGEDVVFAFKHDGTILSPEHGYPVRLV